MLVSQTQNSGVGGIAQRQPPNARYLASQWNIGFSLLQYKSLWLLCLRHSSSRRKQGKERGGPSFDRDLEHKFRGSNLYPFTHASAPVTQDRLRHA